MKTTPLSRTFLFFSGDQEISLPDIDAKLSPTQVLNFYNQSYPQLVTARVEGPEIKNDEIQYRFVTTMGTKG